MVPVRYEILSPAQYPELDAFVLSHPQGGFTQLSDWRNVKNNWGFEAVVCRGESGKIVGSASILIQKIPLIGTSFLYCPRGPVCDLHDRAALRALKDGADELAKRYTAHALKIDPDVLFSDEAFAENARALGFVQSYGPEGFEGIQARFNYRLYLNGRGEEELLANLTQQTRRNLRLAERHGVAVRVCGKEKLDDFCRLMKTTGERDGFAIRPKAYFERFLDALGERARLYLAFYEGRAIAGAIAANAAGKTCYVYGASDNEARNVMPNYLVQWEMIRWAVETGCSVYDFQGVSGNLNPENNHLYGLYRFKKGFNGQLDELAGEFDYTYRPVRARMVDGAIALNDRLRAVKRKFGR